MDHGQFEQQQQQHQGPSIMLDELVAALTRVLTEVGGVSRPAKALLSSVKMPSVQRFNGKDEDPTQRIILLLQICERHCAANGVVEDIAKITLFCDSFLEGDALALISDLIYHGHVLTLHDIRDRLLARYGGFNSVERARMAIMNLILSTPADMEALIQQYTAADSKIADRSVQDRLFNFRLCIKDPALSDRLMDAAITTWQQAANLCSKHTSSKLTYARAAGQASRSSTGGSAGASTSAASTSQPMEVDVVRAPSSSRQGAPWQTVAGRGGRGAGGSGMGGRGYRPAPQQQQQPQHAGMKCYRCGNRGHIAKHCMQIMSVEEEEVEVELDGVKEKLA